MDQVISYLQIQSNRNKIDRRLQARDANVARNLFLRDIWRKDPLAAARHARLRKERLQRRRKRLGESSTADPTATYRLTQSASSEPEVAPMVTDLSEPPAATNLEVPPYFEERKGDDHETKEEERCGRTTPPWSGSYVWAKM